MKNLIMNWGIMKSILSIGVSSLGMMMASSVTSIFVNRILVSLGGDVAVSAYGILNRINMFALMPGICIGQGLQPILGYNYGVKRFDRALKAIKIAIISATILCFVVFLFAYFAPELLVRIFTSDSDLITSAVYASRYIFITASLVGFVMVGSVVFQALGKARKAFVTSLARPFLFLLPLVLLLSRFMQHDGVWLAFPLTDLFTFILVLAFVIPQVREMKKMGSEAINPAIVEPVR